MNLKKGVVDISTYSVLDISCYIINEHNKLYPNLRITNLRLQKLLYFAQALFILNGKECCFKEQLVAWTLGSTSLEVYDEFKRYGKASIDKQTHYKIFIPFDENIIKEEDKVILIDLIKWAHNKTDTDLIKLIHNQLPWRKAIQNGVGTVITLESIKDYFMNNKEVVVEQSVNSTVYGYL